MEITSLTDKLFDGIVKKKKPVIMKDSDNMVSREAKTLEFQISKHLQDKYNKTERISFTSLSVSPQTTSIFDKLVDKEITINRKKAKTWNTLNNCDKWKLVKEYFKKNKELYTEKVYNEKTIKQLLLSNKLDVVYDKDTNSIKEIILEDTTKFGQPFVNIL